MVASEGKEWEDGRKERKKEREKKSRPTSATANPSIKRPHQLVQLSSHVPRTRTHLAVPFPNRRPPPPHSPRPRATQLRAPTGTEPPGTNIRAKVEILSLRISKCTSQSWAWSTSRRLTPQDCRAGFLSRRRSLARRTASSRDEAEGIGGGGGGAAHFGRGQGGRRRPRRGAGARRA